MADWRSCSEVFTLLSTMFWTSIDRLLDHLRPRRQLAVMLADALLILLAWHTTYLFRMGVERWLYERPAYDWAVVLGVIAVYGAVSWALGVPRASWRYVGFHDITRLAWVCLGAGLASAVVVLMAQLVEVPRAVLALHPVLTLINLALARMTVRMLSESSRARRTGAHTNGQRALVLGAGAAGKLLIAGIQHRGWTVVGLLDDDPRKQGARIAGVPVLGGLDLLVFTAGVGEHSAPIRARICADLAYLGLRLDTNANAADAAVISGEDSDVMVGVEPTNEEWVAAVEARAAISHRASP